jgi:glycosyltransferase involved in cell wall biosynthesis
MTPRIYFFANFGNWNRHPYGGGEIGNRRTLGMIQRAGYDVRLIEKYNRVSKHNLRDIFIITCLMAWNIIKFFCILLFGRRKNSLVHIAGFYGSTIYFERILVGISHLLGYRTIYEMRGGGATYNYEHGQKCYRQMFTATIKKANYIFSQGQENKPLLDNIAPNKHFFYYPNCVMHKFCPNIYPNKPTDRINLLYFGRISKQKNVDVIVDTFNLLAAKFNNIYLDIVGNCTETNYAKGIIQRIDSSEYTNRITMHPACDHNKLKEYLSDKHIYLFPTKEPREGHSNALTEAMSWGLIPVATDMGFNRTIVDNDELIVEDLSPEAFALAVTRIIESEKLQELSKQVYQRIQNNFTEDIVYKRLKEEYNTLFNLQTTD